MMSFSSKELVLALVLATLSAIGHCEVYKRVDPITGHVTFTNFPVMPKDSPPAEQPAPIVKPLRKESRAASMTVAPTKFPTVDQSEQKRRDADRLQILKDELAAEQIALAKAQQKNDSPALHRHRANVAALEREIVSVK